jgi:hypothetical protein
LTLRPILEPCEIRCLLNADPPGIYNGVFTHDTEFLDTSAAYVIQGTLAVAEGATLTVGPGVKVDLGTLTPQGSHKGGIGGGGGGYDRVIVADGSIIVDGNLLFEGATISTVSGIFPIYNGTAFPTLVEYATSGTIQADYGGSIVADNTSLTTNVNLSFGSNDLLESTTLAGQLTVDSLASTKISANDFTKATVVAAGNSSTTVDLANNYWGTTDPTQIAAKITDHTTNSNLPTVTYQPFLTSQPGPQTIPPVLMASSNVIANFNAADQNVSLYDSVLSPIGAVDEGTVKFTLLDGSTVIGTPVTASVTSGTVSASYVLPGGTPVGTYTIQAVYSGTANFQSTTNDSHLFVPTTVTVTSTTDDVDGDTSNVAALLANPGPDGTISLREALDAVNNTNTVSATIINFAVTGTITLANGPLIVNGDPYGVTIIGGPGDTQLSVDGNKSSQIFSISQDQTAQISGLTMSHGSAGYGGSIGSNGALTLAACALTMNEATTSGGAIDAFSGALTADGCTFGNNSAQFGGSIFSNGGVVTTITNSTLSGNAASVNGGGILNNGEMTITGGTFSGNSAYTTTSNNGGGNGGGIANWGTLIVTGTTISGNSANCTPTTSQVTAADGGGIANFGTMAVLGSTISGNSAYTTSADAGSTRTFEGGGIYDNEGAISVLTNNTISGNSAYWGGGIENFGTLTVTCATVGGNSSYWMAGGIDNDNYNSPVFTLTNSIVAGNHVASTATNSTPQFDVGGAVQTTSAHNLIGDGDGMSGISNNDANGNLVGTTSSPINPLLSPLGSYGGPTQTMGLLPGSPAIDAGSTALAVDSSGNPLATDQRGLPRVVGSSVDIGSFETSGFTLTISTGNNQSTAIDTAFPNPLEVSVTPNHASDPVNGGFVNFTAPSSGATAALNPSGPVTIASGNASVTATANGTVGGPYSVTAATTEASPVSFSLTNIDTGATTTVNVGSTLANSTYGQKVAFTVTVVPPQNGATPTGTVQFQIDGADLGTAVTLVNGAATSSTTSTLTAATHVISALYSGDGTYAPNSGTYNQVVNKAALTVTADAKSMLYGQTVPALTATISGFVNGDTVSVVSGSPSLSTTGTSSSPVGTYSITVGAGTLSATNYDFPNLVNGTLTINKAHLTVTADGKSMLYGQTVPALTATISGFVNGDTVSVVSGSPSLSTTGTSSSPVGIYSITVGAGTLSATNYDFPNLVNGTLTINKAHLTVTADGKSMLYGQTVPALTATISGFVNGDTMSVVSGSPSLSTTGTSSSPVGTYSITVGAGTLSATNYDFPNLVNGTLTINKAHLTVTADDKAKTQGTPNPTLTATLAGFENGETLATSGVTGAAALSTTADTNSPPGAYAIIVTPGTLASVNYDFPNLVNGTLTVQAAGTAIVSVTSNASPSTYGDPVSFDATVKAPPGGPDPTGTVQFKIDGANFGAAVTLVSGAAASSAISTLAAGKHTVTAVYSGDVTYSLVAQDFTQTVNKAHLTVTADDKARLFGETNPTLTATITGLKNGETLATSGVTGSPGLTTTASDASPVGTYAITAAAGTLAATNYDFPKLVNGTLTINKAHLTVTADNQIMNHGDKLPVLTYSIAGFVNGESASVVHGAPSLNTTASSSSPAGYYSITVSPGTLSASNYTFNFVNGTLTVQPKVLDVRVEYGSKSVSLIGLTRDLPFATVSAIDVIFSDDVTVNSGELSLAGVNVKNYVLGTFGYNPKTFDATWSLRSPVGVDRLILSLSGESSAPASGSGPNIAADPFKNSFAVLPGDVDGDGAVSAADAVSVRNRIGASYSVWFDVNGDGVIDINDFNEVRKRIGLRLP